MKGELGTFLALTGYEVKGSELVGLGLANAILDPNQVDLINELDMAQRSVEYKLNGNVYKNTWEQDYKEYKANGYNQNDIGDNLAASEKFKLDIKNYNKVFEYPWKKDNINIDRNPQNGSNSVLVNDLIKIQGTQNPKKEFNIRNYNNVEFTNSLARFESIIDTLTQENNNYLSLDKNLKEINRCFRFDTVAEIKSALKEENTEFSNFCLNRLNKKSPVSLAVTLQMLRNSRKLDYSEIIQQEINVARNIITKSKDFELYMANKLTKQKTKFEDRNLSKEEVDSYFEDVDYSSINLDLKQHSLLPNRDYIHKYPDCLKFLINENARANEHVRKLFDYESFHYLLST
jgi:enoyl-CoA hydratase/carnithine racemase